MSNAIAKLTERALQRQVVAYLRTLPKPPAGPWWTAINALPGTSARQGAQAKAMGQIAGAPDIIVVWGGTFIGVELKADKGVLSTEQMATSLAIADAGGSYVVARSLDDVQRLFRP